MFADSEASGGPAGPSPKSCYGHCFLHRMSASFLGNGKDPEILVLGSWAEQRIKETGIKEMTWCEMLGCVGCRGGHLSMEVVEEDISR